MQTLFTNYKTYLAAAGLIGLAVYQFSQGDWIHLVGTVVGVATMLGLHVQFPSEAVTMYAKYRDSIKVMENVPIAEPLPRKGPEDVKGITTGMWG